MAGCAYRRSRRSRRWQALLPPRPLRGGVSEWGWSRRTPPCASIPRLHQSKPVAASTWIEASSPLTEIFSMPVARLHNEKLTNLPFYEERVDLACAFRWTARLNMHEAVANHFSLAVNDDGTKFLMNPNQVHFSRIKASDLLLIDANDPETLSGPNAPDPTAWGLHGAIHRNVPHARCVMHVHSIHATVLASLADSTAAAGRPELDHVLRAAPGDRRELWRAGLRGGGRALLGAARRPARPGHDHGQSRHPGHRQYGRRDVQPHVLFRARGRDLHQGAVDRPGRCARCPTRSPRRPRPISTTIPARPSGIFPN